jgi:DNA polymerase-4
MFLFRHIIHIHIPAFPIAVARVCRPELRDRPVVVAPPLSERALIVSVSPEARKQGIFKGMSLAKATQHCPDLTVLPPDPDLADKACRGLTKLVARYTPLWEPSRPGHVYMDVTGTERLWGKAKDAAYRFKQEMKAQLSLSGTVGVAGNKLVSSIASQVMPSEGVLDVDHGREASFMAPLRVRVIPGIGRFRRKILLEELSITRVRELAALDVGSLKIIFGRQAYVIHQRALGIDPTPVCPTLAQPMVSEEITLSRDDNDDQKLLGIIYGLVEKCAHRLRERALFPQKAGLLIRYSDQVERKGRLKLPRLSFWDFELYDPLEKLFFRLCDRRVRVRFIKVWFWDFSASSGQLSLFHQPSPNQRKNALIVPCLDRVRHKHGEEAIRYGRTV